uniref:Uncharacterized protein n=1 Tax=Utricularia reniformis TaxID=192314 RepID=A0A1Y0B023_9LAMI|nr:hypothetical protein AEK19_MT0461 [Utricularia reniformis]ART30721.1 hypothetical protein AEK19_MT0461 [Utricularia reniformis]
MTNRTIRYYFENRYYIAPIFCTSERSLTNYKDRVRTIGIPAVKPLCSLLCRANKDLGLPALVASTFIG